MLTTDPTRSGTTRSTAGASFGITTPVEPSVWAVPSAGGSSIGCGDGISNMPVGGFHVGLASGLADAVALGVGLGLGVGEGDAVGDGLALADGDGLSLDDEADAAGSGEALGPGDGLAPGEADAVAVGSGEGDAPGPGDAPGSGGAVAVGASSRIGSQRRPTCAPAGIEAVVPDESGIVSSVSVAAIGSESRVRVPNL